MRPLDVRVIVLVFVLGFFSANEAQSNESPVEALKKWLKLENTSRPPLNEQSFAQQPLSLTQAKVVRKQLWDDYVQQEKGRYEQEWKDKYVKSGSFKMKFEYKTFGGKASSGWDLYISMHGGGGTSAAANDQQWHNQINLYQPKRGIYLAPRAPTNTWDLWHQDHIDLLFARIIEGAIVHKGVNPNRVYLMGYSAGGDGVYQLAPRMADRFAAAAMMAGHPNETSPLGLRNLGFTIHMGENDHGYGRNKVAKEWKKKLRTLKNKDPGGYKHKVKIHRKLGHWMEGKDAVALRWMDRFTRNPYPERVVWKQDNVTHSQFYWLSVSDKNKKAETEVIAEYSGESIYIEKAEGVDEVAILLEDQMMDLDKPITIRMKGKAEPLFDGIVTRKISTIYNSLQSRKDPKLIYSAKVVVKLK